MGALKIYAFNGAFTLISFSRTLSSKQSFLDVIKLNLSIECVKPCRSLTILKKNLRNIKCRDENFFSNKFYDALLNLNIKTVDNSIANKTYNNYFIAHPIIRYLARRKIYKQ